MCANELDALLATKSTVAYLAARVVGDLRIAVFIQLQQVMSVHIVKAVDEIVTIKGAAERGGFVVILLDHLLVLGFGVPSYVVA